MGKMLNIKIWEKFYTLECQLNEQLILLTPHVDIHHIYNPVEYAAEVHLDYLRRHLKGPKKLLFIDMNPGPDGMVQNGVPFGNISADRDSTKLCGIVFEPSQLQPKRPLQGLGSETEEPSAKRRCTQINDPSQPSIHDIVKLSGIVSELPPQLHLMRPLLEGLGCETKALSGKHPCTLFKDRSNDSLDTFFQRCFVHNFCPLAFSDAQGHNITLANIKGSYKKEIQDICLRTIEYQLKLLQPDIIVAVGDYVFESLQNSKYCKHKRLLCLAHSSPRSSNNTNWPEKAEKFLRENDLFKYLRNEND